MDNKSEIIIYEADNGQANIKVRVESEKVWLTQARLVELFDSSKANISEHIKHIFTEEELNQDSVVRDFRITAKDGKEYICGRSLFGDYKSGSKKNW